LTSFLATVVLTVLALWYGFRAHAAQTPFVNLAAGNWNTDWIRSVKLKKILFLIANNFFVCKK
jgi:hypothetical protein